MNDDAIGGGTSPALRHAHRGSGDKRGAGRIKAVVLPTSGWSRENVAGAYS
jgi:hypothetical protein